MKIPSRLADPEESAPTPDLQAKPLRPPGVPVSPSPAVLGVGIERLWDRLQMWREIAKEDDNEVR